MVLSVCQVKVEARDIYEGDVENNTESSSAQSASEIYDFVPAEDEVRLKLVLSPDTKTTSKARSRPKASSTRNQQGKSSKVKKSLLSKAPQPTPLEKKKTPLNENRLSEKQDDESKMKRKRAKLSHVVTQSKVSRKSRTEEVCADSGVFMTPPSLLANTANASTVTSSPTAAPTSTPTFVTTKATTSTDDSCFGFDSLASPPPFLSPVQHILSPGSGVRGQLVTSQSSLLDVSVDITSPADKSSPVKLKTLDISKIFNTVG